MSELEQQDATEMILPDYVQDAGDLTQYAVQTRYPGDWEPVSRGEMEEKIDQAVRILAWAQAVISANQPDELT